MKYLGEPPPVASGLPEHNSPQDSTVELLAISDGKQLKKSKLFNLKNLKVAMELHTVVAYKMNNCKRADLHDICVSGYHCN